MFENGNFTARLDNINTINNYNNNNYCDAIKLRLRWLVSFDHVPADESKKKRQSAKSAKKGKMCHFDQSRRIFTRRCIYSHLKAAYTQQSPFNF